MATAKKRKRSRKSAGCGCGAVIPRGGTIRNWPQPDPERCYTKEELQSDCQYACSDDHLGKAKSWEVCRPRKGAKTVHRLLCKCAKGDSTISI